MSRSVAFAPLDMTDAMLDGIKASNAAWLCRAAARRSASCVPVRAACSSWFDDPRWCLMV